MAESVPGKYLSKIKTQQQAREPFYVYSITALIYLAMTTVATALPLFVTPGQSRFDIPPPKAIKYCAEAGISVPREVSIVWLRQS